MSNTYDKLGRFSAEELPQIPTDVVGIQTGTEIDVTWTNNNVGLTGTTNIVQVYEEPVWVDKVEVAYNLEQATVTGQTEGVYVNIRVAVFTVADNYYYPSTVVPSQPVIAEDGRPLVSQYIIPEANAYSNLGAVNYGATSLVTVAGWFRTVLKVSGNEYAGLMDWKDSNDGVHAVRLGLKNAHPHVMFTNSSWGEREVDWWGGGNVVDGTWRFLIATYDTSNGECKLRTYDETEFKNETIQTMDVPYTLWNGTADKVFFNSREESWDMSSGHAQMNNFGIWTRKMSEAEMDEQWNAGLGKNYGALTSAQKVGLESWWKLDEESGAYIDSHGITHLNIKNNEVNISLEDNDWTGYIPIPDEPTNFGGYTTGTEQVYLYWDNNNLFEDGYKIYKDDVEIEDLGADTTNTYVNGLTSGDTYQFRVSAYNTAGETSTSNIGITVESPAAAINVTGASLQEVIAVSWTNVADFVEEYKVYQDNVEVGAVASSVSSYLATGLTSGTTYEFKVGSYIAGMDENISVPWSGTTSTVPITNQRQPLTLDWLNGRYTYQNQYYYSAGTGTFTQTTAGWFRFNDAGVNYNNDLFSINGGEMFRKENPNPNSDIRTSISQGFNWWGDGLLSGSPIISGDTWYFLALSSDYDGGSVSETQAYVYDENGLVVSGDSVFNVLFYSNEYYVGSKDDINGGGAGNVQSIGVWTDHKDSTFINDLWNGGAGVSYDDLAGKGLDGNLWDFWNFSVSAISNHRIVDADNKEGAAPTIESI